MSYQPPQHKLTIANLRFIVWALATLCCLFLILGVVAYILNM